MFELSGQTNGIEESNGDHAVGKQDGADMMMATRTFLSRRSDEPPFAPRQYFYPASKTGVVPSWRFVM